MTPLQSLTTGVLLGLAAGVAPGPLTALVIAQTLRHGVREGMRVALAPILTDGPLLTLSALLVASMSGLEVVLGLISVAGAAFVAWMAWDLLTAAPLEVDADEGPPRSIAKALATNLLNPHPYVFWVTVGGPLIVQAHAVGWGSVAAFCMGFFTAIVGTKLVMAWMVGRASGWLEGRGYVWTLRVLGVAMAVFAVGFAWEGMRLLGA